MGRYEPASGLEVGLARQDGMKKVVGQVGRTVKGIAAELPPDPLSGRYRASLRDDTELTRSGWVSVVSSSSPFWHLIEFGSKNNPAYAPMRRALETVLTRTERTPK